MAIFPPDDISLSLATRNRLKPLISGYNARFISNVKRNSPTAGASQSRDVWGKKKFTADCPFSKGIDDIELLLSFWDVYGVSGFTFFDFVQTVIGAPGYRPADALGTGDGATLTFTIRAKEIASSSVIVYDNGVAVSAGFYSLSAGTGAQGEDRIVFGGGHAPAAGHALTIAYKGRRRYTCEIVADPPKSMTEWDRFGNIITVLEKF